MMNLKPHDMRLKLITTTLCFMGLMGAAAGFFSPAFLTTAKTGWSPSRPLSIQHVSAVATEIASRKQILEFREPKTNVSVVLVGAMHYNPTSIQLAVDTLEGLASQDRLGSVIIESCNERWNETNTVYQKQPLLEKVLQNEMRAASKVAFANNIPVVLGDQCINETVQGLKSSFGETLLDLVRRPVQLAQEISRDTQLALPSDRTNEYLDVTSILDPMLLLPLPVSLVKYPFSFIARSPIKGLAFLTLVFGPLAFSSQQLPDDALFVSFQDLAMSILIAVLEVVVFSRIFTRELLVKRNEVLARNILSQCQLIRQAETLDKKQPWWKKIFSDDGAELRDSDVYEVVYAAPPKKEDYPSTNGHMSKKDMAEDKAVVAVLGLAHCNGIKKLLREELV